MERHTAAWWSELVAEVERGGDARGIARRHGVKERTLFWWRAEVRKRGGRTRLLPVTVAAGLSPPLQDVEVVLEFSSARVTVRGAVTAEHIAALMTATRAC
jgi:transposase-like protein